MMRASRQRSTRRPKTEYSELVDSPKRCAPGLWKSSTCDLPEVAVLEKKVLGGGKASKKKRQSDRRICRRSLQETQTEQAKLRQVCSRYRQLQSRGKVRVEKRLWKRKRGRRRRSRCFVSTGEKTVKDEVVFVPAPWGLA